MTENVESMTLVFLRRLDERLDRMEGDLGDIKLRMTASEEHLASMMMSLAGVNARMDKIDARLARVERRVDLTDAK
jgi:septal ring factor EnvC (AmiA/AmiB activator)